MSTWAVDTPLRQAKLHLERELGTTNEHVEETMHCLEEARIEDIFYCVAC